MALLTTYTNANKITSVGLAIRYAVTYEGDYYKATRTARKEYRYVGMTLAAAEACRQAKIAQYTNARSILKPNPGYILPDHSTSTECMANVSVCHGDGDSWFCAISVNESDVRASIYPPANAAAMFTSENARQYDEADFGLTLSSVVVGDSVTARYVANIDDFDPDRLILQNKPTSTTETWTTTNAVWTSSGTLVIEDPTGYAAGQLWRLCYGSYVSATVIST